jgi:hypothetical protein
MSSTFTPNKVLEEPANGDYVDTWNVPVNRDMTFADSALGETIVFNATGVTSQVLYQDPAISTVGPDSYVPMFITIVGSISNDVIYTIPSGVGGTWTVRNITTDATGGPWSVYFDYAGGGTSVAVERGITEIICCDTTPSVAYRGIYKPSNVPGTDSVGTTAIQDGAVTYAKLNSASLATVAEYRAGGVGTASFTGSVIASTSMTVSSVTGTIIPGMVLSGGSPAVTAGTTIVSQTSGTTGGAGVYVISASQTAGGSITATIPDTIIPTTTAWDSAGYVALTPGATVTPDFSLGYNFSLALNSVSTLANPTNVKIGQTGIIAVTEGSSSTSATITGYIGASFNGTISGTTLTATGTTGGIVLGAEVSGSGVTAGTTIVAYGSGTGGDGTYTINISQTVSSSTAMTTPSTALVVTGVTGTIYPGMALSGTGVSSGTTILSQSSGTTGSTGVYVVSTQQRVASTTMTGNIGPFFSSYGSYYKFPNGVQPTFTKTAGALNIMSYSVLPGPIILLTTFSGVA